MVDLVRADVSFLRWLALALVMGAAGAPARADVFTIDFNSTSYFDYAATLAETAPATWNSVLGQIQAPWAGQGVSGYEVDFGDGSLGAFANGPAQNGITVNGSTITFDTDVNSGIFNFTSFTLSAGNKIVVTGTQNNTLRLNVQGNVTIDGTIDLTGQAGAPNSGNGPNAGGIATGGGGNGGNGASSGGTAATAGGQLVGGAGGPTDGGGFGPSSPVSGEYQGGGGGCFGAGPDSTEDNAQGLPLTAADNRGNCGSDLTVTDNRTGSTGIALSYFDTQFFGGAGGGGGGAFTSGATYSGGGGGAGGGAIRIAALGTITVTGEIKAIGGAGGNYNNGNGTDCGGGGGGGSGGAIFLQSAGAGSAISGAGTIDVSPGQGGTSTSCEGSFDGGVGSAGIYRADTLLGAQSISNINPSPSSGVFVTASLTQVSGQTYTLVSKPIQLSSGTISLGTPVETVTTTGTGCGSEGSIHVTYAGSTDGLTFGTPVPASQIATLGNPDYLQFTVTINTTGTNPPCLTGLQIPFTVITPDISNFELQGGMACASLGGSGAGEGASDLLLIGLTGLIARLHGRRRARRKRND